MYSIKDQANVYLERINAKGKSTITTVLVIIPLITLLLIEVQENYGSIQIYLDGRESNFKLTESKKKALDTIGMLNKKIGDFYKQLPQDTSLLSDSSKKKRIVSFMDSILARKRFLLDKYASYSQVKRIHNDTIESKINELKIPIELPVLKKTTILTVKTVVLIIMILLTGLQLYLYFTRVYILRLLKKFIDLQPFKTIEGNSDIFCDVQLKLPVWCLPLQNNEFKNSPYRISRLMGISRRLLGVYNIGMTVLWLFIFILNVFLAKLNWDIHYKLYHQVYSLSIPICFFLLLFDVCLIYLLLRSIVRNQKTDTIKALPGRYLGRLQFIGMISGSIGCFIFQPVYSRLTNGSIWFHKPRFKRKHNKWAEYLNGFYTNSSKSKKRNTIIHYIASNQRTVTKTISEPEKFKKNLVAVSLSSLLREPKYILGLKESDLLQFFNKQKLMTEKSWPIMNRYLSLTKNDISPQFIDMYTFVYNDVKSTLRKVKKSDKILRKIVEIKDNSLDYLPRKYAEETNQDEGVSQQEFDKVKSVLIIQLSKRIKKWEIRLNDIRQSSSLV